MTTLDYGLFDFDNHYYEATDAFTRHLDRAYRSRGVQWSTVDGKPRLLVGGRVNRYVANPTFFTFQPNFVLRPELEDGDGDDSEACISRISNLELHVTYTVPDKP